MNNGKICVSVCAENADSLIQQIKRAEELADVIEIRFDCLDTKDFDCLNLDKLQSTLNKIFNNNFRKETLTTFRIKEQGGKRDIKAKERENFWNMGFDVGWADLEEDIIENSFSWLWKERICSYHNFNGTSEDLDKIYRRLNATNADIIKIADQTNDVTDTIKIWKLLEKANQENQKFIPIAMGEAGKWTRILGLAHGAFMTYAALETGKETASGQISAGDLIETYRVRELDEQTEIYGILGNPVSHSLSPYIHNAAFKFHHLNAVFIPFEVNNLDEFIEKFVRRETREITLNFKGFSVTAPHKQAIIKHLDSIDETAETIGAVNTVKIVDGELHGYNTDAAGFIEPLKNAYGDLKNVGVAVVGGGGAARAAIHALQNEGANVTVLVRNLEKSRRLSEEFRIEAEEFGTQSSRLATAKIIVNSTPLGTKGALENETPLTAEQMRNAHLAYDLVYNPFETLFLREAKSANVPTIGGLAMLIAQAMEQSRIWTGRAAPMQAMSRAALARLQ